MKTTKFSDCECGGTISLVNEGSNRYPCLRIACDNCKNGTIWFKVPEGTGNKQENYSRCYKQVLEDWNTKGKFLNGLKYEYFCDVSYFDTYLVRDKKDRNFGCGWSVFNREDAINLCKILNGFILPTHTKTVGYCNEGTHFLEVNELRIRFINPEECADVENLLMNRMNVHK